MSLHHLSGMMAVCRGGPLDGREHMVPFLTSVTGGEWSPRFRAAVSRRDSFDVVTYELDIDEDGLFWRWLG